SSDLTEAEWEYAAYALQGNLESEVNDLITDRKIYPWNGNTVRYKWRGKYQGEFMANFKHSAGNYMGVAGKRNDQASIPGPVRAFYPNDFGLRSEEHTSELQSRENLVCRLL